MLVHGNIADKMLGALERYTDQTYGNTSYKTEANLILKSLIKLIE